MRLLQQIQNDAVDTQTDLAALLRRCRILAQRLKLDEFKDWVVSELDGYPSANSLPPYRTIRTPLVLGHFSGVAGARIENAQIPLTRIPPKLRDSLTSVRFQQGVTAIAAILDGGENAMRVPWPLEAVRLIGQGDIYRGYFLMQAVQIVNHSEIRGLLDQVRNRVLNFALELESRDPEAGEAIAKPAKISGDEVRTIFYQTIIKGDVHNLAQSSQNFSQMGISVCKGDVESLQNAVRQIGVHENDIKKLVEAIREDRDSGVRGIGDRVKAWLGSTVLKAGRGAVAGASTALMTEIVKHFFSG